ncbi:MAG: phage tail protein [Roseiflexaceae bacterium]|nr:phage tail protein [Roseiflexaceae bacterium]
MPQESPANCRFYVSISGIPQAVFTEVSGLQVETTLQDYEEGGNNEFVHRLPIRTKVGNVTLKRGMTKSNEFLKWYLKIVRGEIDRRPITVLMFDPKGTELCRWNFSAAFPVKWVGPQFSADGKTLAIETLEFTHKGVSLS